MANSIREFVTINRGTGDGGGLTRIGSRNWILAYSHIAHDCIVGDDCVFSNNATLAGHVTVGNHVILSGFSGVHQFCRIGDHAFIGMGAFVNGDVPPFLMIAQEKYARPRGINAEGLKRRGFDATRVAAIKRAYRALYNGRGEIGRSQARAGGDRREQRGRARLPRFHRRWRAAVAAVILIGCVAPAAGADSKSLPDTRLVGVRPRRRCDPISSRVTRMQAAPTRDTTSAIARAGLCPDKANNVGRLGTQASPRDGTTQKQNKP